jgi:hypothetical protein
LRLFTSPRSARGEVGSRSDPGEGLALRFSNDSLTGRAPRVDDFPTG